MSNRTIDADRQAQPAMVRYRRSAAPRQPLATTAATFGVVAAGVALLEVALIPGMLIGGAAVLAPRYLPQLRRRIRPLLDVSRRRGRSSARPADQDLKAPMAAVLSRASVKQAIAKTITFRIIVTSLDFSVNYLVIGEFATAAGLSGFSLMVGPLFYLLHETAWNRFGSSDKRVTVWLPWRPNPVQPQAASETPTISRALAKTITFRTIATTMDFTTNFVVVGDLASAVALSASGFILGPFVYLGHEWLWDRFGSSGAATQDRATMTNLLPGPGAA